MRIQISDANDGFVSKTVRVHGMRDGEFVFDKGVFDEKEDEHIDDNTKEHQYKSFIRKNIEIHEY